MKSILKPLGVLLIIFMSACESKPQLNYRYADKGQPIACDAQINPLLNEALHSFENAIIESYDTVDKKPLTAYAKFAYAGFTGSAEYKRIATPHDYDVRDALLAEGILAQNGNKSNLNYNHPAVQCIINNLSDAKLKKTIQALIDTESMNPELFNSRLRNVGRQTSSDRYLATYTALDAFYQHLVGLEAPQKPE